MIINHNFYDEKIIEMFFDRDENAISESENKYGAYCMSIAMNITGDKQDSEECLSDTWLSAWNTIPPQKPNNLGAYLGKLVRNHAINKYNMNHAQKRMGDEYSVSLYELEECLPDNSSELDSTNEGELGKHINEYLKTQKELMRKLFVSRYFYNDSIKKISEDFKISESHVKSVLFRMRKSLKRYLEDNGYKI